eukprot:TRINITY_DN2202_c0_g1_i2.p1 TRINITY_DN2202_c0_g1~~TRINITY_DN2202_c0_g1_i2.p1  ORF type:complete len:196 (-),score=27.19 TRINITY_DN2202_c0_g1_i2:49-636(-)
MGAAITVPITKFVSNVFNRRFLKRDVRIVMLGLDAAGKTSLLYRLKLGESVSTTPTVGFSIESVKLANGIWFTVWDVGGQERIRHLWSHYFRNSQGIVYVVDSHDRDRMEEVRSELQKILQAPELVHVPLLVYANKQDLSGALAGPMVTYVLQLAEVRDRPWTVVACSALTGEGVAEGMDWLAKTIESGQKTLEA